MDGPSDRCEYEHDRGDHFKPYRCIRSRKQGSHCVWHARVTGKPGQVLSAARPSFAWVFPDHSTDRWLDGDGERLDGAFLRGADLRSVPLSDCTLMGADLAGANLRGGTVENADLREASMTGVNARQCRLSNSVLEGADLSGADLRGADLSNAALRGADLRGADLREAVLSGADLRKSDLQGADLQGVELQGTRLFGVDLTEANLIDADLTGANLGDATLAGVSAVEADFAHASVQDVDLTDADLRRATLVDVDGRGAVAAGADLRAADLTDADLVGADLTGVNAEHARLSRATLHEATFEGVRLYGAVLGGVQMNDGTTLDDRVPYDPAAESAAVTATETEETDPAGTPTADGGYAVADGHVEHLTKAADSYRSLASLAAANEFPERRRLFRLRRKQSRRRMHRDAGRWGAYTRATLDALVTGHGENPWRVVGIAAAVVVMSGLLYPLGLMRSTGSDGSLLQYPTDGSAVDILAAAGEGLYVSLRTFALGTPGYAAVGAGKLVAGLEAVLGVVLVAVLVAVLARRAAT